MKYLYVVMTNAVEGKDAEFNEWYDNQHIDDVLRVPGFVSAQRFRIVTDPDTGPCPQRYLSLYELETDDLPAAHKALVDAAETPVMPIDPSLDFETAAGWYYEPITERIAVKGNASPSTPKN